jgi:hypothetical protein
MIFGGRRRVSRGPPLRRHLKRKSKECQSARAPRRAVSEPIHHTRRLFFAVVGC